jgi:plastocyanin
MRCLYYSLLASLAFIYSVAAQSATTSSSPSFQTVLVGYQSHSFYPNNITANPGDVIVFQFIAQGHTVVQSNFQEPCVPRDAYHRGLSTFFSGWYNTTAVDSDHVSCLAPLC